MLIQYVFKKLSDYTRISLFRPSGPWRYVYLLSIWKGKNSYFESLSIKFVKKREINQNLENRAWCSSICLLWFDLVSEISVYSLRLNKNRPRCLDSMVLFLRTFSMKRLLRQQNESDARGAQFEKESSYFLSLSIKFGEQNLEYLICWSCWNKMFIRNFQITIDCLREVWLVIRVLRYQVLRYQV